MRTNIDRDDEKIRRGDKQMIKMKMEKNEIDKE